MVEKMAVLEDLVVPKIVPTFGFEARFDAVGFQRWFRGFWWWSFVFSAAYLLLVFGGRRLMRDREKFDLQRPLVLWNAGLALFSTVGAVRTNATLISIVGQKGFLFSVCDPLLLTGPVSGFWTSAYSISKLVEFGDTFFIVLRKRPLIVLHWYHHVSVCVFNWYAYADLAAPVGYFVAMNYTVHAVMYTYFAVRAMGYRLPRKLSITITVLQSSQMVGGLLIGGYAHVTYHAGTACNWSDFGSLLCLLMYGSYLALFLDFFCKSYVSKTPRPKRD